MTHFIPTSFPLAGATCKYLRCSVFWDLPSWLLRLRRSLHASGSLTTLSSSFAHLYILYFLRQITQAFLGGLSYTWRIQRLISKDSRSSGWTFVFQQERPALFHRKNWHCYQTKSTYSPAIGELSPNLMQISLRISLVTSASFTNVFVLCNKYYRSCISLFRFSVTSLWSSRGWLKSSLPLFVRTY